MPPYFFGAGQQSEAWWLPNIWECIPASSCLNYNFGVYIDPSTTFGTYVLPITVESDSFGTVSSPFNVTVNVIECLKYGQELAAAAAANNIDPFLLAAIAAQESGHPGLDNGDATTIGDFGNGYGLMQIDKRAHPDFTNGPNPLDPQANANYGAALLAQTIKDNPGNLNAAILCYNACGTSQITVWPDGAQMLYADSVLRHEALLKTDDADFTCGPTQRPRRMK
jgi:hypothetical protein